MGHELHTVLGIKGPADWLRLAVRGTNDSTAAATLPSPPATPPQDMLPNRQPEGLMENGAPVTPPVVPPGARAVPGIGGKPELITRPPELISRPPP